MNFACVFVCGIISADKKRESSKKTGKDKKMLVAKRATNKNIIGLASKNIAHCVLVLAKGNACDCAGRKKYVWRGDKSQGVSVVFAKNCLL